METRETILSKITDSLDGLSSTTATLVAAPSPNPPGDTTAVAYALLPLLQAIPYADVSVHEPSPGIVNLVARIQGGANHDDGKRLVFNGHLDTYPLGDASAWTATQGEIRDGKLYGRGAADMKGGVAASILAAKVLAEMRDDWTGELVLAFAGDEETMGVLGTQWLIENVDAVGKANACVCGDAGSPSVVRFGEKGLLFFEIEAEGKSAHGAHLHKGVSAVDRLRKAMDVVKGLEDWNVNAPKDIEDAIDAAREVSEKLSGEGESETLKRVTVNIGTITAGMSLNLIPSRAVARGDIRLPVGINSTEILSTLESRLQAIEGVHLRIIQRYEPTYTSPSTDIVQSAVRIGREVTEGAVVANMRVGASDTRLFRAIGIPSVVVGCTPWNMGAPDEYVDIKELLNVAKIHALIAWNFLKSK